MTSETEKQLVRELIEKVRCENGTDSEAGRLAFEELLRRYEPLIAASVLRISSDEAASRFIDDLRQEATVVFYNSILTYDIEQTEVEFGLYAKICISNALVSQLRSIKRRVTESLSEEESSIFVHDSEDPTENILEQERVKALYSVIRKNLSAFE